MTVNQFQTWLTLNPIESLIILVFLFLFCLLLFSLRKLRKVAKSDSTEQFQLQQKMLYDYENLNELLEKNTQINKLRSEHLEKLLHQQHSQFRQENEMVKNTMINALGQLREHLHQQQSQLQNSHGKSFLSLQNLIAQQLKNQTEQVRQNVDSLNKTTESRLKDIASQVNQQLEKGFHKTQHTFTDIQKRLSIIDEAQKRIGDLSANVTSLQNVLTDKRTRGAFGEMQLQTIVENALPPQFVDFQYVLSNNKRADCIIHLPDPSGDMVIDAKFPLESYRQLVDDQHKNITIEQTFKRDIRKHITDIASKYILPPETAESAILFLPAEAIFAEIHANHHDLVEFAQRNHIWLTSPTTLMAILMTAKSVIKDDATRQQAHIMREQLFHLRIDFERFQARMTNLSKRIEQAGKDVAEVNTSATKISKHFQKIEATDEWTKNPESYTSTKDKNS